MATLPASDACLLSLCMIVRDEEATLARCLDSVIPVVDQLVVVDTGSRDGTVAVARAFEAEVVRHDASGHDGRLVDFAAARNDGLDRARGRFVLVLDADEVLDPASRPLVRGLAEAGEDAGHVVQRRNHLPESAAPAWVDHAVRLFPNRPGYRYRHRVHETIDDAILAGGGRLRRSSITLDHFLAAEADRRRKALAYVQVLLEDVAAAPDDVDRLVFLAAEYHQLQRYQEATGVAERICGLRPDDPSAWVTAATYHLAVTGEAERARAELTTALALRPGDPEALALLAAADNHRDRVTVTSS